MLAIFTVLTASQQHILYIKGQMNAFKLTISCSTLGENTELLAPVGDHATKLLRYRLNTYSEVLDISTSYAACHI